MWFLLRRNILYHSKVGFDDKDTNIQSLYGIHKKIKTTSKYFDKNLSITTDNHLSAMIAFLNTQIALACCSNN